MTTHMHRGRRFHAIGILGITLITVIMASCIAAPRSADSGRRERDVVDLSRNAALEIFRLEMADTTWESLSPRDQQCVQDLQQALSQAIHDAAFEALALAGCQGGYFHKPDVALTTVDKAFVPYFYHEGDFLMPERDVFERELGWCMDAALEHHLNRGQWGEEAHCSFLPPTSPVTIAEDTVRFDVDMSLVLERGPLRVACNLRNHPFRVASVHGAALDIAKWITEGHRDDPDYICMTELDELAKQKRIFVDLVSTPAVEHATLYQLRDELDVSTYGNFIDGGEVEPASHTIGESPQTDYVFQFLCKYPQPKDAKTR